jgi:flagellar biosynthetic protein FliR
VGEAMAGIVGQITNNFDYTLLLFLRVSGLIWPSPVFGRKTTPAPVKICFIFVLTFIMLLAFPVPQGSVVSRTIVEYTVTCLKELLFGLSMGFVTSLFFNLVYSAGQIIDMQIGFGIVSVYDIQNNTQVPVTGNILNIVLLIVFFCIDGHLKLISILYFTFAKIPVGHVLLSMNFISVLLEAFSLTCVLAVMVAMPILAAGLILEISMGVLIRSVPQMNMFVIGVPIKIVVGLLVLLISLPVFVGFSNTVFAEMFQAIEKVFATFGVLR